MNNNNMKQRTSPAFDLLQLTKIRPNIVFLVSQHSFLFLVWNLMLLIAEYGNNFLFLQKNVNGKHSFKK